MTTTLTFPLGAAGAGAGAGVGDGAGDENNPKGSAYGYARESEEVKRVSIEAEFTHVHTTVVLYTVLYVPEEAKKLSPPKSLRRPVVPVSCEDVGGPCVSILTFTELRETPIDAARRVFVFMMNWIRFGLAGLVNSSIVPSSRRLFCIETVSTVGCISLSPLGSCRKAYKLCTAVHREKRRQKRGRLVDFSFASRSVPTATRAALLTVSESGAGDCGHDYTSVAGARARVAVLFAERVIDIILPALAPIGRLWIISVARPRLAVLRFALREVEVHRNLGGYHAAEHEQDRGLHFDASLYLRV